MTLAPVNQSYFPVQSAVEEIKSRALHSFRAYRAKCRVRPSWLVKRQLCGLWSCFESYGPIDTR